MKNRDFKIGCHLSFSGGYAKMGRDALSIDANAFQYFSRNPRGGKAKEFDPDDAAKLLQIAEENGFAPFLVHAPYTYNPCSADESLRVPPPSARSTCRSRSFVRSWDRGRTTSRRCAVSATASGRPPH